MGYLKTQPAGSHSDLHLFSYKPICRRLTKVYRMFRGYAGICMRMSTNTFVILSPSGTTHIPGGGSVKMEWRSLYVQTIISHTLVFIFKKLFYKGALESIEPLDSGQRFWCVFFILPIRRIQRVP